MVKLPRAFWFQNEWSGLWVENGMYVRCIWSMIADGNINEILSRVQEWLDMIVETMGSSSMWVMGPWMDLRRQLLFGSQLSFQRLMVIPSPNLQENPA